eukprot:UN21385
MDDQTAAICEEEPTNGWIWDGVTQNIDQIVNHCHHRRMDVVDHGPKRIARTHVGPVWY